MCYMLKSSDFMIRDPFILPYNGTYYLYASNFPNGFKAYTSTDLINWTEPTEIIHFDRDFWATKDFWAPEVHLYKGSFYLFASLFSEKHKRGTQIFKADNPLGPFEAISDGPVTPRDWMCLDGTLYVDRNSIPYIVFCHEWTQVKNGTVCYAQLSDDFTQLVTEPKLMFSGGDYDFVSTFLGDNYITDGPFLYRTKDGSLLLMWSSCGKQGYFESLLKSDNDEIDGNWNPANMIFETDGGHGMVFNTFDNKLMISLHAPNSHDERLALFELEEKDGSLYCKK